MLKRTVLDFCSGLTRDDEPIPQAEEPSEPIKGYEDWLSHYFPHIATAPLAERHHRLWKWFEALEPGKPCDAQVEIWARGSAKSSTAELGVAYLERKTSRRFVLYVSATQDQADLHVRAIASLLEAIGVDKAVGRYGHAKGWRRDQLITASGFAVAAYGLDTAGRGVKIDQFRPDLIIFDDIDSTADTGKAVAKKLESITKAILPTGSVDCAVLFIQNLIHEEGIVHRLWDGRANFLLNRKVSEPEPAVRDLMIEEVVLDNGLNGWKIVGGEATWEGQPVEVCEKQINDWSVDSFLAEAQHDVQSVRGYFFDEKRLRIVERDELPTGLRVCAAWDFAATEGAGDWTVRALIGIAKNGKAFVLDVFRAQINEAKVEGAVVSVSKRDAEQWGKLLIHLPEDPGAAGKIATGFLVRKLRKLGFRVVSKPVQRVKKAVRAKPWARCVNAGNAALLKGPWNGEFKAEHRKFDENEDHEFDDQVDAASDGYTEALTDKPVGNSRTQASEGASRAAAYKPR